MPVLIAAAVACSGFWILGWLALNSGHPNEDAYILFKYVDNLVAGHGIVFYAGGPPTEGATDFLWLLLLSGLAWLGMDVAIAAVLWNGVGAGLAAGIFAAAVIESGTTRPRLWAIAVSLFVLLFHGAIAGMSGFSSMLFSSLMLVGCVLLWRGGSTWLPVLGLVLALFRPEGVIPGVAFAVVGWFQVNTNHRRYLLVTAACFLVGVAYLIWHHAYFGLWFPLSVYAKSGGLLSGGLLLPGLADNFTWLHREIGPLPFLIASGWIFLRHRPPKAEALRCLWAVLPVLLLLVPLALAVQTQNVRWRFQAPVTLAIAWFTWRLFASVARGLEQRQWVVTAIIMILAMAPSWVVGARRTWQLVSYPNAKAEYTATFAPQLGDLLGAKDTFMLTEAGILAYWTHCRIVDVVGLNDARFVRNEVSVTDIVETKHPAVVMFNAYEVLDLEALRGGSSKRLVTLDRDRLASAIRDPTSGDPTSGDPTSGDPTSGDPTSGDPPSGDPPSGDPPSGDPRVSLDRARRGARALATFLAANDDYHLRAVFLGRNNHVYGFRKDHSRAGLMLMALAICCDQEPQPSYLEVKNTRRRETRQGR